jgi:hypothetical protein
VFLTAYVGEYTHNYIHCIIYIIELNDGVRTVADISGAANLDCGFNGQVYCCRFRLEPLWVISSHNLLSHSVT